MAGITSRGETGLYVIGVGRGLEILHVAGRADTRGQTIVSIHVALRTLQGDMRAGQRESSGGVIESCVPGCRRMTGLAGLREARLHVVRIARSLEIFQVARYA